VPKFHANSRRVVRLVKMAFHRLANHVPHFFQSIRLRDDRMSDGAGVVTEFGIFLDDEHNFAHFRAIPPLNPLFYYQAVPNRLSS
jgi:hypothetical protein